jgi:hypothetical protein
LEAGAAELRDPHPQFDAVYYAQRHLDAAVNPLLYHLRVPQSLGHKRRVQILQSVMRRPAWPEAA